MKNIVLFGGGKSATCLIDYLSATAAAGQYRLTVADANAELLHGKLTALPAVHLVQADVNHPQERDSLVKESDLVISLLPPALHLLVANSCLKERKNLITASYVDENLRALQPAIEKQGLLFLCEMGLDPGIDHMSACLLIHRIRGQNGNISAFRSHTGGLIAPECDDNPWHYKISWNARNVVRAGASGAVFKENNQIRQFSYHQLFENTGILQAGEAGTFAFYPNRDSLPYISLYDLPEAETFVRTTLRHPDFCRGWKDIVAAGLTDDRHAIPSSIKTIASWSDPLKPYVNAFNRPLFDFLGLFDNAPLPQRAVTSADVLQSILETKWSMKQQDKDLIVMVHELDYSIGKSKFALKSCLVVKGDNGVRTAMAKTVGLPLGIAARLILENRISLKGLQIPVIPAVYQPVMKELAEYGIRFQDTVS